MGNEQRPGARPEQSDVEGKRQLAQRYQEVQTKLDALEIDISTGKKARSSEVSSCLLSFARMFYSQEGHQRLDGISFQGIDYGSIDLEDYSFDTLTVAWSHLPLYAGFQECLPQPKPPKA